MNEFANLLEPNRLPCMTKVWQPQMPNTKNRYLTPEELKLNVLHNPRIKSLIDEFSNNDEKKKKELHETVTGMLNEIGFTRSLPVIRWAGIILNRILTRMCTGVYVNEQSISHLKSTIGNQPVLYLPSHRSYADFVLMSYICFAYDLEIPGIAAGMDFHGMVGVGGLLRKTGAFFMRRSFSSDKLYWHVFKEYMRAQVNAYHSGVEFFIEGTRSRSCKALPPKIGLLSMALEPLFMGEVNDITIVPIGVAYEKPMEEQLFAFEMLGIPKPRESTMALFKAMKILDKNHGAWYVNFGQPISAKEYLKNQLNRMEHAQLPVHVQSLSKTELNSIQYFGQHILAEQQKLIVLSTFNLISIYLNFRMYLNKKTNLDEMCQGVLQLKMILNKLGALVATINETNAQTNILESIIVHDNLLKPPTADGGSIELVKPEILNLQIDNSAKLKGHKLSANTIRNSVPALALQLYSNPCLFWLAKPAFIILATKLLSANNNKSKIDKITLHWEMDRIKQIFSCEFILDKSKNENDDFEFILQFLFDLNILDKKTLTIINNNDETTNLILSSIAPFISCYFHVANTITNEFAKIEFIEKELLVKVQERVEYAINAREQNVHPYCLSLDSINLALISFHANNYLDKSRKESSSTVIKYQLSDKHEQKNNSIFELCDQLKYYSQLLPFNYLNNFLIFSKL